MVTMSTKGYLNGLTKGSSSYVSINDILIDEREKVNKLDQLKNALKNIYNQIEKFCDNIYFVIVCRVVTLVFLVLQIYGTVIFEMEFWNIKSYSNNPYNFVSSCNDNNTWFNGTINDIICAYDKVQPAYP